MFIFQLDIKRDTIFTNNKESRIFYVLLVVKFTLLINVSFRYMDCM